MDYNARFYSPRLGRFVQADSITPNYLAPQTYNRFSYVYNSPTNYFDDGGHCPKPSTEAFEQSSGSIICIAAFIPTAESNFAPGLPHLEGDNRSFTSDSNRDGEGSSRGWVWVDAETGDILDYAVHESCQVGGDCVGPREVHTETTLTFFENWIVSEKAGTTITVNIGLICDGGWWEPFCALTFNGEITIDIRYDKLSDGPVANIKAKLNNFPNWEAYYWEDEETVTELFTVENFSDTELESGVGSATNAATGSVTSTTYTYKIYLPE
jgi:hypothetical protein